MIIRLMTIAVVLTLLSCGDREPVPPEALAAVDKFFIENPPRNDYLLYYQTYGPGTRIWVEVFMLDHFPSSGEQLANIHCPRADSRALWEGIKDYGLGMSFITLDREIKKVGVCANPLNGIPGTRPLVE